mmetsp:Transcript_6013/g.10933  ORF Transcript_6013/g.10933 Transcript_6013/m.10933 type:complete len:480 (+) Transcript_6013:43-1482(+)
MPSALICAQAFPPLLKQAGGVAKDYLALCRALIDGLGWKVTLLCPVNIGESGEKDVERWLITGQLIHVPVWALQVSNGLGVAVLMDFFSIHNTASLLREVLSGGHDVCFIDDSCMRIAPLMLMRSVGLPGIATTHSDVPSHPVYHRFIMLKILWWLHLASAYFATIHASVASVYAKSLQERYRIPVQAVWPPVLWSEVFRRPLHEFAERASRKRAEWVGEFGFTPKAILLYAGRWSSEKRIHLLHDAVPDDCCLVIVGDSDADYADQIGASRRRNVLPLRGMLGAEDLRTAYAASDLFVSASTCETLGNTVVEAWSAGVPVAIQPFGGHLEFVKDTENSYFINFDDSAGARRRIEAIVAGGAKDSVEPALSKMGEHFRNLDFPDEIHRLLLEPAMLASSSWQALSGWRWMVEGLLRCFLVLACCLIWPVTIVWSRLYFAMSCDPTYRYVKPGTAKEPGSGERGIDEPDETARLALLSWV